MSRIPNRINLAVLPFFQFMQINWIIVTLLLWVSNVHAVGITANIPVVVGQTAANFVGTIEQDAGSVTVSFLYGSSATTLDHQTTEKTYVVGSSSLKINQFVSNLNCDTTYFYRLQVASGLENASSDVISFKTNPCVLVSAQVTTLEAINIEATKARLTGSIATGVPYSSVQYYFEHGMNATYGEVTAKFTLPAENSIQKTLSYDVFDLTCNTNYHFRMVVEVLTTDQVEETLVGEDVVFSTGECPSIAILNTIELSTAVTMATLRTIVSSPQETVDIYFAYGETNELGMTTPVETYNAGTSTVTGYITELKCDQTYYFVAIAQGANTEVRSETLTFTTVPCSLPPTVSTLDALNIQQNAATLKAAVTPNGAATNVYFEWGLTSELGLQTTAVNVSAGQVGQFEEVILNDLVCNTVYYIKAIAENDNGVATGDLKSFLSLPCDDTVEIPNEKPVNTIFATLGSTHGIALAQTGEIITWGDNAFGQLGGETRQFGLIDGVSEYSEEFLLLSGFIGAAAGGRHSVVLNAKGDVFSFGDNTRGQLGVGTGSTQVNYPVHVISSELSADKIIQVAAGDSHSVALTETGFVYVWGDNHLGQLADPALTQSITPVVVAGASQIKSISAGMNFTVAIKEDGNIIAWGDNQHGQTTNSDFTPQFNLQEISQITNITQVSAGAGHVLALRDDGTVFSWGNNSTGQLGRSVAEPDPVPSEVTAIDGFGLLDTAVQVSAGGSHSLALLDDGSVVAWGDNSRGQLGIAGAELQADSPAAVINNQGLTLQNIRLVAAGDNFSLAITQEGEILTWGDNSNSQLNGGSDGQQFGTLRNANATTISLLKPHIVVDAQDITIAAGEVAHLRVRLSASPAEVVAVSADLQPTSGLFLDRGSQTFFSTDSWHRQETLTINAQNVDEAITVNLVLSSPGLETVTLPVTIEKEATTPRQQVVGALSLLEIAVLSLFLGLTMLRCRLQYLLIR